MSLETLRERARALDPEPIAALATRMLELWTPPGEERPMADLAAQALRDAGVQDVVLDEDEELWDGDGDSGHGGWFCVQTNPFPCPAEGCTSLVMASPDISLPPSSRADSAPAPGGNRTNSITFARSGDG